jgi:hypothetical protein
MGFYCTLHITLSIRVNKTLPTPGQDCKKIFFCQGFWKVIYGIGMDKRKVLPAE